MRPTAWLGLALLSFAVIKAGWTLIDEHRAREDAKAEQIGALCNYGYDCTSAVQACVEKNGDVDLMNVACFIEYSRAHTPKPPLAPAAESASETP